MCSGRTVSQSYSRYLIKVLSVSLSTVNISSPFVETREGEEEAAANGGGREEAERPVRFSFRRTRHVHPLQARRLRPLPFRLHQRPAHVQEDAAVGSQPAGAVEGVRSNFSYQIRGSSDRLCPQIPEALRRFRQRRSLQRYQS